MIGMALVELTSMTTLAAPVVAAAAAFAAVAAVAAVAVTPVRDVTCCCDCALDAQHRAARPSTERRKGPDRVIEPRKVI